MISNVCSKISSARAGSKASGLGYLKQTRWQSYTELNSDLFTTAISLYHLCLRKNFYLKICPPFIFITDPLPFLSETSLCCKKKTKNKKNKTKQKTKKKNTIAFRRTNIFHAKYVLLVYVLAILVTNHLSSFTTHRTQLSPTALLFYMCNIASCNNAVTVPERCNKI
jgi:hypothetical protein